MTHGSSGRVTPRSSAFVVVLSALMLTALPVTARLSGESPGSKRLRPETMHLLQVMEGATAPGCPGGTLTASELTAPAALPPTSSPPLEGAASEAWQERWVLDRCGAPVAYDVHYTPSDRGTTDIAAGLAAGNASDAATAMVPVWAEAPSSGGLSHPPAGGATLLVTSTSDSGPGSLSQAILDANAAPNRGAPDVIRFDIPGSGPRVISLVAALPAITDPVVIDGYTQPGATPNTLPEGSDAVVLVEIDGGRLGRSAPGLLLRAGSSTVRGVSIHGFDGDAIRIEGGGSNRIEGNVLGGDLDAHGSDDAPGADPEATVSNTGGGVAIVASASNRIGGADPASRNLIAGNGGAGVLISGTESVGNAILGNRIARNDGRGIELDGIRAGAARPEGAAPNNDQRPPLLTSMSFTPARGGGRADAAIEGMIEGGPGALYRIELYATRARANAAAEAHAEGERFLASTEVTTGADGRAGFQFHLPRGVHSRDLLTATATDVAGNTSEFSEPLQATAILISWNAGTGNWNVPGNWAPPQLPAVGDDVIIAANGTNTTFTVTLNVASSLNTLSLGGGSGIQTLAIPAVTLTLGGASVVSANGTLGLTGGTIAGTGSLTIDGTFNWSGGLMTGAGTTTVNGPFNLSGLTAINLGRTLDNNSTATWTSAANLGIRTGSGSIINNIGTWDAQTATNVAIVNFYGGASTFNNSGTFRKSGVASTTSITVPFVNTGTVDVQTGTLNLGANGSSTTALNVSGASATLLFGAGVFDLNAGTTFSGPGTVLLNSTGTLNVNAPVSIPAATTFTFLAGNLGGTGTFTTNGIFNWSGGLMTGAGTTTVNGPFNLSGLTAINLGRTLDNNSTATWTSAANLGIRTGSGSIINNIGTWDAQTATNVAIVNFYGGASTFNNSGTFRKSGVASTTSITVPFVNTGTVDVQTGTLNLGANGSSTTALNVSGASATLLFGAGVFDLNAGTTFSGPGTVLLNSTGTLNVNAPVSIPAATTFTFLAGNLGGTGTFTTNGIFNWSGGLMTGAGTTTVNGPFNLSGLTAINLGRTLDNNSTATWTSAANLGIRTGSGSIINNIGTWDAQTATNVAIVNFYGGASTFNNSGTFRKSTGSGTTYMNIPFVNTGTVDVQTGTFSLGANGSSTSALNVSGASATLLFAAGVFDLNAGTTISGPGTVLLNSTGTVNVNAPVTIPAATSFTFLAGTLGGTGTLTTDGTFNWSGGLITGVGTTTVNGPFNLSGLTAINNSRTLNTTSTTNWTSANNLGMWTGTGSVINNSGTWDSQSDGVAIVNHYGGATTFNNTGTFKKSAGPGGTAVSIPFVNTGTVDVQSGTLNMSSSNYTQTAGITRVTGGAFTSTTSIQIQGGALGGSGTVTGPVIVSGTGALAPGLSPGTLNLVGNYTQQAPNGAFNVEIGGTTPGTLYDRANVSGTGSVATLAGTLNVSLVNGYVPVPGDSFTVMTYVNRNGTFTVNPPALTCLGWQVTYGPTALVLTVVALPAEVTGLGFPASSTGLAWNPGPIGPAVVYDVLRGAIDHLPVGQGAQTCMAQSLVSPAITDATVPALDAGFWYLVRERRAVCGVGTYGRASSGVERISTTCP